MAVASDSKLGPYEIISPLGAGGMGEDNGTAMVGLGLSGLTWSREGKQLYFRDAARGLMAVDVQPQADQVHSGLPRQIFAAPGGARLLDSAPGGRILVMVQADQGISPSMTLVLNRDAELKK
jgi:hypothetical protein